MKNFIFIMMTLILCVGCRSSRQETSSSLTDIRLEELISQKLIQFHTGNKITDIHHRDSATIIITEYNAPDSSGHQSKKSQTVISSGSETITTRQETDSITTESVDSISIKQNIHRKENKIYEIAPVPWYSGFELYIVLAIIAALLYLLNRLKKIKL